jgi:hypothetical protein
LPLRRDLGNRLDMGFNPSVWVPGKPERWSILVVLDFDSLGFATQCFLSATPATQKERRSVKFPSL